jgi:hypothetical protein
MTACNCLLNLQPIRAGQSFRDPYRKLNVNVLEEDTEGALVQVTWD